ncbi:hypothetical protein [Geoalkalibacter sp.]|uniref:hypothetical protein n=1 Tax=Geoalkalibacter sp. TaxID=3041440 RepID=UPI00272EC3E6|nr:hypothetical protein [Geoalkalibacter sp.]
MFGVGILLSELAHEAQHSVLDRVWPFFLLIVAAAAIAAVYFALRKDKGDAAEDRTHDD